MKSARVAVPDLISNSYFPAIAAIALDLFAKEGLDARLELIFPNYKAYEALRDGEVDFVAGPAHVVLRAFPEWHGVKLLAALAQGTYWLLVMRSDLDAKPGDVNAVRGRTIAAAPLVEMPLRYLLSESGIDLDRDNVLIVGTPGAHEPGVSSGVAAAKALEAGTIDGFWANAMGAQNAIASGANGGSPTELTSLTQREHEVLALLSKGHSHKFIAARLRLSAYTVHGHVRNIFEKLGVHNRVEAVVKYFQK